MKKLSFVVLFIFVFFGVSDVYAHPGRTDANGCHTCRGNCARWGLAQDEYHCHNSGGSAASSDSNSSSSYSSKPKSIYGCTDSGSINYNPNANVDDGSCINKVYGCTREDANNYNKDANTSDGSCLYTKKKISYQKIKYKTKYKKKFFYKNGKVLQKGKKGKRKIEKEIIVNE